MRNIAPNRCIEKTWSIAKMKGELVFGKHSMLQRISFLSVLLLSISSILWFLLTKVVSRFEWAFSFCRVKNTNFRNIETVIFLSICSSWAKKREIPFTCEIIRTSSTVLKRMEKKTLHRMKFTSTISTSIQTFCKAQPFSTENWMNNSQKLPCCSCTFVLNKRYIK